MIIPLPLTEGKIKHGAKPPASEKPNVKPHGQRAVRPMTEEEIKTKHKNKNTLVGTEWKNKKTNKIYKIIFDYAIECTNGREDIIYIVYYREGLIFVREYEEFFKKFTQIEKMKQWEEKINNNQISTSSM